MNLELTKKRCVMGVINNRIEKHGDQDVTAFDIPIDLLLDPKELIAFLGPYVQRALYNTTKDGVAEPMVPEVESYPLKDDLECKAVTLAIGHGSSDYEVEFEDARLKSLTLFLQRGGETQLKFKLQIRPQNKHVLKLLDSQNCEIKISTGETKIAEKAKRAQGELELGPQANGNGAEPPPDGVDGPTQDKRMRAQTAAKLKREKAKGAKAQAH